MPIMLRRKNPAVDVSSQFCPWRPYPSAISSAEWFVCFWFFVFCLLFCFWLPRSVCTLKTFYLKSDIPIFFLIISHCFIICILQYGCLHNVFPSLLKSRALTSPPVLLPTMSCRAVVISPCFASSSWFWQALLISDFSEACLPLRVGSLVTLYCHFYPLTSHTLWGRETVVTLEYIALLINLYFLICVYLIESHSYWVRRRGGGKEEKWEGRKEGERETER